MLLVFEHIFVLKIRSLLFGLSEFLSAGDTGASHHKLHHDELETSIIDETSKHPQLHKRFQYSRFSQVWIPVFYGRYPFFTGGPVSTGLFNEILCR